LLGRACLLLLCLRRLLLGDASLLRLRRRALLGRLLLRHRRLLLRRPRLLHLRRPCPLGLLRRALLGLLLLHQSLLLLRYAGLLGLSRSPLLRLLGNARLLGLLLALFPGLLLLRQRLRLPRLCGGALLRCYGLLLLAKRGGVGLRLLLRGLRMFGRQSLTLRLRARIGLLPGLKLGILLLQSALMRGCLLGALLLLQARLLGDLLRSAGPRSIKRGRASTKALPLPSGELLCRAGARLAFCGELARVVAAVIVVMLLTIAPPLGVFIARHIPLRTLPTDHVAAIRPLGSDHPAPLALVAGEAQGTRPFVIA